MIIEQWMNLTARIVHFTYETVPYLAHISVIPQLRMVLKSFLFRRGQNCVRNKSKRKKFITLMEILRLTCVFHFLLRWTSSWRRVWCVRSKETFDSAGCDCRHRHVAKAAATTYCGTNRHGSNIQQVLLTLHQHKHSGIADSPQTIECHCSETCYGIENRFDVQFSSFFFATFYWCACGRRVSVRCSADEDGRSKTRWTFSHCEEWLQVYSSKRYYLAPSALSNDPQHV